MLIVTYSCDHNHPPPSSRNIHHRAPPPAAASSVSEEELEEEDEDEDDDDEEEEEEEKPRDLAHNQSQELILDNRFEGNLINGGEFGWLTDFESTSSMILLESTNLMEERRSIEREMATIFSMREEEEEEDLFAGLGELPECSTVFRRGMAQREAEQRRRRLATTGWGGAVDSGFVSALIKSSFLINSDFCEKETWLVYCSFL